MSHAAPEITSQIDDIRARIMDASVRLEPYVHRTPLLPILSEAAQARSVAGKAENLQITGSFKARGALNKAVLCAEAGISTLVTSSTGNHGAAVAFAAQTLGLGCVVYVPAGANESKVGRISRLGAQLVEVPDALGGEIAASERASTNPRWAYLSPYDDLDVIAGQGTIGLELLEQCDEPPDAIFVAVGGGGLATGIAAAIRPSWPSCRVIGCFPAASPALERSVAAGRIVEIDVQPTLSDGTAGNIVEGSVTFDPYRTLVNDNLIVDEAQIEEAMRHLMLDDHLVVEGAAGVAAAAFLTCAEGEFKNAVIILCGGNVDPGTLRAILSNGR